MDRSNGNHVEVSASCGSVVLGEGSVGDRSVVTKDGVVLLGLREMMKRSVAARLRAHYERRGRLTTSNSHFLSNFFFFL